MFTGHDGPAAAIRFAANFSEPAEALLLQGRIELDVFKCPAWPDVISRARAAAPVYVHFPLFAGHSPGEERMDLDLVERLYRTTETPHVNIHLDPQPDSPMPLHADEALQQAIRDVSELVSRFGPHHVVVENVPFWRNNDRHVRLASEPWFIRRVLDETGAGLLLDLAHARIAAVSRGLDAREYVAQLPVERVGELHVTGIAERDGWLRDHLPMTAGDWDLFEWAVDNIREGLWAKPRLVALEYGGLGERFAWRNDAAVLAAQAPRVYEGVCRMRGPAAVPDAA